MVASFSLRFDRSAFMKKGMLVKLLPSSPFSASSFVILFGLLIFMTPVSSRVTLRQTC